MRKLLFLVALLPGYLAIAQNEDLKGDFGTFNVLNLRYKHTDHWSVAGEAQLRSLKFYDDFHYYEIKGIVMYHINQQFEIGGGGGKYKTYSPDGNFEEPVQSDEWRTWQQLSMKLNYRRLRIEHRYRVEQRFTTNGYRNRFRYRLGFTAPLNKPRMEKGTLYLNQSNEVFFTNKAPYFERLRFFIGAGFVFSNVFTLQMGYLHQFDYQLVDETGRDMLQVALQFDLERRPADHPRREAVEN
ncbi:MAG: DUF2490 domain-containing protein [Saprospiraceae bacterium]|nr:DUF2490 domain-containing protein [Saprospiraceae bacterium]